MAPSRDERLATETGGDDEQDSGRVERRDDLRLAILGGVAGAVVGFGGMVLVGTVNGLEAQRLLAAVVPTVRFAASAYVAGGATVLALMLTMITFSITHDLDFRPSHYRRIRQIATLTTIVIAASVLVLMLLSFPLDEVEVARGWYVGVYYVVLLGGSVTGGAFISLVLMLFYAIRELITVGEDPEASSLVRRG